MFTYGVHEHRGLDGADFALDRPPLLSNAAPTESRPDF